MTELPGQRGVISAEGDVQLCLPRLEEPVWWGCYQLPFQAQQRETDAQINQILLWVKSPGGPEKQEDPGVKGNVDMWKRTPVSQAGGQRWKAGRSCRPGCPHARKQSASVATVNWTGKALGGKSRAQSHQECTHPSRVCLQGPMLTGAVGNPD